MADLKAMQQSLQQFQAMLMRMLSQDRYIKKSGESWLERSLKQYAEQEAMVPNLVTENKNLKKSIENLNKNIEWLITLTRDVDEHPEDYDGPCECHLCQSYMDDDYPEDD